MEVYEITIRIRKRLTRAQAQQAARVLARQAAASQYSVVAATFQEVDARRLVPRAVQGKLP